MFRGVRAGVRRVSCRRTDYAHEHELGYAVDGVRIWHSNDALHAGFGTKDPTAAGEPKARRPGRSVDLPPSRRSLDRSHQARSWLGLPTVGIEVQLEKAAYARPRAIRGIECTERIAFYPSSVSRALGGPA